MQKTLNFITLAVAVYLTGYVAVRLTHTKSWFDRSTGETGSHMFFDTWSTADPLLYRVYYPMLVLDSVVFRRPFERDKW